MNDMCASMERRERKMWRRQCNANIVCLQLVLLILSNSLGVTAQGDGGGGGVSTTRKATPPRITKPMPVPTQTTIPRTTTTTTTPTTTTTITGSSSGSSSATTFASESTSDGVDSPTSPLKSSSSTESSLSTNNAMEICMHGITAVSISSSTTYSDDGDDVEGYPSVRHERAFVEVIQGDVTLSILTTDPASALFVVDRINHVNFIESHFEMGMRAIMVDNDSSAEHLLMQEVEYQQQCVSYAVGIFVDFEIYERLENMIKELDYNIWPIPSANAYIFPKAANLLHKMPWGERSASVEIVTENTNMYNKFVDSARREQMCLMHFKSPDSIYIVFGNKMSRHFEENGTIFAIPTERTNRNFIDDLPNLSYVLMESELEARIVDQNSTQSTLSIVLSNKSVLPSRMLTFAQPFLELMRWLKGSLQRNCQLIDKTINLNSCDNLLTSVADWRTPEYQRNHSIGELLDVMHMRKFSALMNFKMFQKVQVAAVSNGITTLQDASDEKRSDKREIASQNYVTNVTTFYHYNRGNQTQHELQKKFGEVFNCNYSARENSRYPYLFDGESVMYWRIKPDAWVATGYTACILGVIITLAILVFIVVRISLGDVFEGNPVTSILLLISLIVLFTSFVPFSMEYVGEQRNSHVTVEDVGTLNTLCAVRVFILTLVYCFAFSLLLCRAVMLASIGSEGGFLSHVNGYLQAVICVFSVLVQLCMSVQLLVVMHIAAESVSCENIYYGHWLWGLIAYDFILLACIVGLVPFIYRSQRNYREGILIVIAAVLMFIIWLVWIVASMFGDEMRDAAIPLGMQATGWAILVGILIPRTFLIVRGIERSDIAQALPSLTSLAFAQNNQYTSEQSVYECVNPAMRQCSADDVHQSPSEIPTLPLRGGGPRRQQFFANLRQANANINPQRPPPRPQRPASPNGSMQSSLPPSPDNSKITRF